ncbi:Ig-like domain repeat protein [Nocardioides panacihumi]|uniref:Ig-like domain repeat protein n=1 Tax=Nocardioides panacihumi TaxID=400774 RepID=UPI0031D41411
MGAITALLMPVGVLAVTTSQASALAAPPALAATTPSATQPPTFTWDRVPGAWGYDVEVSADNFATTAATAKTVNDTWIPTVQLPVPSGGDLQWHVRAKASINDTTGAWSTTQHLARSAIPAPQVTFPVAAGDSTFTVPSSPLHFEWTPVPGATSYAVQVANNGTDFGASNLKVTASIGSSSFTPNIQLAPGTYWWRVSTNFANGVVSDWTDPAAITVSALPEPTLRYPADGQTITGVRLDWDPVPGAASYDIRVSKDADFKTIYDSKTGIQATSYSPPTTYHNGSWYWQVRPLDATGNGPTFDQLLAAHLPRSFVKNWTEQPQPQWPLDGADLTDAQPLYYQWAPVKLATYYRLDVSTTPNFAVDTYQSCTTVHTTFVPGSTLDTGCFPRQDGTNWWRVVAFDSPRTSPEVSTQFSVAPTRAFSYSFSRPNLLGPLSGTVDVPTLRWDPVPMAETYQVTISPTDANGTPAQTWTTDATSFTPPTLLKAASYRWDVRIVTASGSVGVGLAPGSQPTFTISGTYSQTAAAPDPTNSGVSGYRPPTLQWNAVTGAKSYTVMVARPGATAYTKLGSFAFPAGEDVTAAYGLPGIYRWYVEAYADNNILLATSHAPNLADPQPSDTTFTILDPGPILEQNYHAALSGNELYGNAGAAQETCSNLLPATCQNLRQTPVLDWSTGNRDISTYRISFYADAEKTTPYPQMTRLTALQPMWASTSTVNDAQAGQEQVTSSYYWVVVPCVGVVCESEPATATHAFNKKSLGASSNGPGVVVPDPNNVNTANLPTVRSGYADDNDVTLSWDDILDTEYADNGTDTALTGSVATTTARQYDVQISNDPNFGTLLDSATVDQTWYTSSATYPDGPVYWRVRAIDGSNRAMNWSSIRGFTKASYAPTGLSPAGGHVSGKQSFSWSPLAYARDYDVEVYAGGVPSGGSTTNRVVNLSGILNSTWTVPSSSSAGTALSRGVLAPGTYTWRVRGSRSATIKWTWSDWQSFTVDGPAPATLSPGAGATVKPNDTVFSWTAPAGIDVSGYTLVRRLQGPGTTTTVTTPATSYAPTESLATGTYDWWVTALDPNGKPLGSTPIQSYSVQSSPIATTAVSVTGQFSVDGVLTATTPTWDLAGTTTSYEWLRNGTPITGATATTYVVVGADKGYNISVRATGSLDGYNSGSSTSAQKMVAAGPAASATVPPQITGTARVGEQLSASDPVWNVSDVSTTWQWKNGTSNIAGATGPTYTLKGTDAGKSITVVATGKRAGYADGVSVGGPVTPTPGPAPVVSNGPSISGPSYTVGATLTAVAQWTAPGPNVTVTPSYQWLRNGVAIGGATRPTYILTAADAGHSISVRAAGTAAGYETGYADSAAVQVAIGSAPVSTASPSISGTPRLGAQLSATSGSWSPGGARYTYQWLRNGSPIAGATASSYRVGLADVAKALSVRVTATIAGRTPGTATSAVVRVPKVASRSTLSLKSATVRRTKQATVTITVTASGIPGPTGTIQILAKGHVIATKSLTAGQHGKLTFRLPKLKRGRYPLVMRYAGSATVSASQSSSVTLKVTR